MDSGNRLIPDFALQILRARQLPTRRFHVRQCLVGRDASIDVLAESLPQLRLRGRRKQVDTVVSRTDRVGFVDHLVAPYVKARESARKREGNQQAEKRKDGSFEGADAR